MNRRAGIVALGLAALVLMVLLVWFLFLTRTTEEASPSVTAAESAALRPGMTERARRTRAQKRPVPQATVEDRSGGGAGPDETRRFDLGIRLRETATRERITVPIRFLSPPEFWPTPDEVPLPDIATTHTLEAWMEADIGEIGREGHLALRDLLLDTASEDGLDSPDLSLASEPWLALVSIQVEDMRQDRAFGEALAAWREEGEPRDQRPDR